MEKKTTGAARRVIESTLVGRYEIALTQNSGGLNSQRLQALLIDIEAPSKASPLGVCTGLPVCRRTFHRTSPRSALGIPLPGAFLYVHSSGDYVISATLRQRAGRFICICTSSQ